MTQKQQVHIFQMSNDSAWYSKNEKYGEIKDSTFQKTMFEFGAGTESIFTGIENCFGVNDDLDGIPMQTVTSKVDGLIMSDAGTVESKIYGISKIGGALLPIAAVSVIPGAGGMAASGEIAVSIGTASAYGLSAGGNAYASAKQEGYTDYQSKMYGTMAGVKETAKMMAFAGVSKIIPANGTGSLLKESLSIGATDAVIEFADETLVTPNMSAQILDNPELKEVNYKEALLNSLATGGMFAGIHLVGGTVKNIGNKLQEKKTAGNNDIALSEKEGNYANEQYLKNLEKIYDDIYSRQTEVNYEYEEFLNDINDCSKDLLDGIIADNVTKVEATENITTETSNAKPIETGNVKPIESGTGSVIKNIQSKSPQQLIEDGWEDITNPKMAANTNSREFYDPKSGLKIRFDKGVDGANGFEAVDHYHVMNPNYTNKKVDYYLDIDGKPVGKGSKASHIVIKGEE